MFGYYVSSPHCRRQDYLLYAYKLDLTYISSFSSPMQPRRQDPIMLSINLSQHKIRYPKILTKSIASEIDQPITSSQ